MNAAAAPKLEVCPEYQVLLQRCQQALTVWQQRSRIAARSLRNASLAGTELSRLQDTYTREYAALEGHERSCATCQYIAKVAGLDFESMSDALTHHRRLR